MSYFSYSSWHAVPKLPHGVHCPCRGPSGIFNYFCKFRIVHAVGDPDEGKGHEGGERLY